MFAFGLAGCGAGSFNGFVDHLGMTRSRNLFNSGDRCAANRAFDARRMTGFRAGGRLFSNINRRMTGCIKHFSLGFAANSTSVSLDTGIAAGRGSRNYALVPAVTLGRDNFLCNKNLIADGAVLALSLAGCGAGSCNSFVDYFRMPLSRNLFLCYKHFIANRAMFAFGLAGFGAGGLNCRVNDLGVSLRGNFLLCNDDRVADRAMLALGLAGCGAGGFNCRVDDLSVSLRGNFLLCNDDRVADRAMFALGLTGLGAGGFHCRVDDLGVSLRGNHFTAADLITALPAVGIAGVTGSGTGGVLRIANLRIGMAACNSKLCSVRGVAGNSSNGLIPAAKRIGVHVVIRTGRRHAAIDGHRSIFLCLAIQLRAVPVQPPDCVGAQFLLIHGSILRVAHYRNRLRCPADKAIGILRISRTGRRHATIDGRRSIFLCRAIQLRAVPVFPGDGSLIGGGANHTSLLVKAVTTLLHQAIGCFYPIGAVLDHGTAGLVLEIVVVAFHVAQTGLNIFYTVLYPVDIALPWVETVHMLLQNAVCAKHVDNIFATFVHGVETGSSVFAGSEVIPVSVHGVPLLRRPGTCPHILGSRAVSDQITAN